jgi:hypothetical protein
MPRSKQDGESHNIADRRARVAAALQLVDEILLVGAGEPVALPEGADQAYPFRRVDQSDSARCGAERPGRDSDYLPVLFRGLCLQCKPLHAVLPGSDRPFSETDRVSVTLA